MKVTNPKIYPLEDEESKAFASYLQGLYEYKQILCFSHIPNETSIKSMGYAMKMKAMGKRKGVPDFIIVLKSKVCFVEMKRQKNENGTTASSIDDIDQLHWLHSLNKAGNVSKMCFGAKEAISFIESML